jgi:hypothetical protein
MGFNVTSEKATIFRNEHNGKIYYSTGLSKKKQDGTYENGYIPVVFKKNVDVPHLSKINITNGFITFYPKDKITIPQIFVMEFEIIDYAAIAEQNDGFSPVEEDPDLPF